MIVHLLNKTPLFSNGYHYYLLYLMTEISGIEKWKIPVETIDRYFWIVIIIIKVQSGNIAMGLEMINIRKYTTDVYKVANG